MADLFFYGTLCHVPLLELVLGRSADRLDLRPARLEGHGVYWAQGEAFPTIRAEDGSVAVGLVALGLGEEDVARLMFYEGGFNYDLAPFEVTLGDGSRMVARMFQPREGRWPVGSPWDLAAWENTWAPVNLRAAAEIMAWYGRLSPEQMAVRFGPIQRRASSQVLATGRAADPDHDPTRDVVVAEHRRAYLNFFAVDEMDLQYRRHDGRMSDVLNRAALMVGEASVVLPYDPRLDAVLLVEQFRAPVFMVGDPNPWVWEPVAGLVDAGETPEQCAHREAMEEAGVKLSALHPAGKVYSSTGSSSEFLNLYIGMCDLSHVPSGGGGLVSEGEDLRSRLFGFDELIAGVDAEQFRDMPLVTTALWLARHRERLRGSASGA
ncbi:NUDIX domain-containing protein [Seohaeicola zhoushanensis]|uniref:ADP-ribose pyrophosphatase n=1 Tax=Seohaeicola zhoushanensis TaxID=1569283 RepID=A0A8J3H2I4_9RHOB|nr:NUDIX domain-containing protein [Seohaeicola zhoushanensis]GHF68031.1 tellurite resistance protein [Seohaeicola zhoushanensis]